jgi:hypothetical protein
VKHAVRLALVALVMTLLAGTTGQAQEQKFSGHLVDTVCATGHAHEAGYATNHENSCNLMPGCIKSGYSLITGDRKALKFDAKGAEQALALVKKTSKEKDLKATVVGTLKGDTITVTSISLD